jgi:hypothetical protein
MLSQTKHESVVDSWHIDIGKHKIPLFPYKRIYSEDLKQSGLVTDAEHIADARLIAAAPELLEALKGAVTELLAVVNSLNAEQMPHDGDDFHERLGAALAAIAKATGGQA